METSTDLQRPDECFAENQEVKIQEERIVKRLTFKNIIGSLLNAFNLEYGVVFTLKQLFVNPGWLARDYITSGRYRYTPPFRLLLITTALTLFFIEQSTAASQMQANFFKGIGDPEITEKVFKVLSEYRNIWFWIYIPIVSLFTWPIFRKQGFNYAENVVLHTYAYSISNLLGMLVALDHWVPTGIVWGLNFTGACFYFVYSYKVFFNRKWLNATFEMLGLYIIASIVYTLVVGTILVAIIVLQSA